MRLSTIAKKIINEDTWGNNVSQGGGMSGGRQPADAATEKPASTNVQFYDVKSPFNIFQHTLEKQEEAAKKSLDTDLTQKLGDKKVTVRASKGSMGQVEKDYTFVVGEVEVVELNGEFYVVLKDVDKVEYFLNTEFKVKIDASAPTAPTMGEKPEQSQGGGNIVHQPVMGMASKGNVQQAPQG